MPFVDVVSRVLKAGGTTSPCLNDFPLCVRGQTGWWRLLPRIKLDVAPQGRTRDVEVPHHQFDCDSGLYSEDELLQWQHLQSIPTMQRLLTADLTQGVCHEKEGCTLMPIPRAHRAGGTRPQALAAPGPKRASSGQTGQVKDSKRDRSELAFDR